MQLDYNVHGGGGALENLPDSLIIMIMIFTKLAI